MNGVVTVNFRLMLQQYETQLMAARRLARYRRARRLAEGEEEVRIDPEVRRRAMVERVAKELYEMILLTGVDNPVVDKIRDRLGMQLGNKVRFAYPPGTQGLRMVREEEGQDPPRIAFTDAEQAQALHALWEITLRAVSESMIYS